MSRLRGEEQSILYHDDENKIVAEIPLIDFLETMRQGKATVVVNGTAPAPIPSR